MTHAMHDRFFRQAACEAIYQTAGCTGRNVASDAEAGFVRDWDSLRFALAMARHRSQEAAGRALKVDESAVRRRIAEQAAAVEDLVAI